MNANDMRWLLEVLDAYRPPDGSRVVEIGPGDSTVVRDLFAGHAEYLAVNRGAQPVRSDVLLCSADEAPIEPRSVDLVISTSTLEHDPDWRRTVQVACAWLRPGGYAWWSFGADINPPHTPDFTRIRSADFLAEVTDHGMCVLRQQWADERYRPDVPGQFQIALQKKRSAQCV